MKTKVEILEYLINEELKVMRMKPKYTRPMSSINRSYCRLINKIRIQGWIKELRKERGES